jgi:hypothetical protein
VLGVRTLVLGAVGLAVAALFAYNVASLGADTGPLIWTAAAVAALGGAGVFLLLLGRPPAVVERLTGPRRGLLPIVAAGIAVLVVGSAPAEGQLLALAFFAGLLAAAVVASARRRARQARGRRAGKTTGS